MNRTNTSRRDFFLIPGQQCNINFKGDGGAGYQQMIDSIRGHLSGLGLHCRVDHVSHGCGTLHVRCMTPAEERARYLDSLEPSQLECLRGHLDALGFDLDHERGRLIADDEDHDITR